MRFLQLVELVLEAPRDDLEAEVEEVLEDLLEVEPLGRADLRVLRSGTRQVRLTLKFVCSGVCL